MADVAPSGSPLPARTERPGAICQPARRKSNFTSRRGLCHAAAAMRKMTVFLLSVLLVALFVGCTHTSITNLTSTTVPREPNNLYRVEYQWNSNQQTVIAESITPYVVSGADSYAMMRVKFTPDRWEAWVPVPANRDYIVYHFKVDYKYRRFGGEGEASQLSPEYKMVVK